MSRLLAHSLRRSLVTTIVFAGLALLPSALLAARGGKGSAQDREEKQQAVQERGRSAPEPAGDRLRGAGREAGRAVAVPRTPAAAPERGAPAKAPAGWGREQRTPVSGWGGREQPSSRADSPRFSTPGREVSRPDVGQPVRGDPYQRFGQPDRNVSTPEQPRQFRVTPVRQGEQGDRGGPPTTTRDPYQFYRPPREVTTDPPVRQFRVQPREQETERGDRGQGWLRERPNRDSGGTDSERTFRVQPRPEGPDVRRTAPERGERPRAGGGTDAKPLQPGEGNRWFTVPEAKLRGPRSDEQVRQVPIREQQQLQKRLRERLREDNGKLGRFDRGRPTHDVIGNPVPKDSVVIVRDTISRISIGYHRIRREHGEPGFRYLVTPRCADDYWDGYWDGYGDGYQAGRRHRHHPVVVISFYYPFYFSDPYWFGFYYPGYYPAVYHYYGWGPGWIYPARAYYYPTEYVYYPATPYRYYYTGYHLDYAGASQAIGDVRRAWLDSDVGPLSRHLTDQLDIRVYFDGEYSYTASTEDFYAMTLDTLATTQTVAMDFDEPVWVSSREVFYTGRQVFYDPDGQRQTVYLSFRLRQLGSEWYVVAVGTSLEPIRHQYEDFRYS